MTETDRDTAMDYRGFVVKKMTITALIMAAGIWAGVPVAVQAACNANVTATAPDSRYIDNGDNTVTDKATGLMWKQCSEGQSTTTSACDTGTLSVYTWQEALQQAEALNSGGGFAGYTDWRLPNRNELATLVERQCWSPALNTSLFPGTGTSTYWTSSPHATFSDRAWFVGFSGGGLHGGYKSSERVVRLVRGGQ